MPLTREILNSHPISTLKKEISKTNIKGYSKMSKNELVELMMDNKKRFSHIKMNNGKGKTTKSIEPDSDVLNVRKMKLENGTDVFVEVINKKIPDGAGVYNTNTEQIGIYNKKNDIVNPYNKDEPYEGYTMKKPMKLQNPKTKTEAKPKKSKNPKAAAEKLSSPKAKPKKVESDNLFPELGNKDEVQAFFDMLES